MIKKQIYKQISGILTLLLLVGGVTWYIQDTETKTACRAGWEYADDGYWKCITKSGVRYELCFEVYDSANTENYWCKKGEIVKEEKIEEIIGSGEATGDIHCNNIGKCW